MLVMVLIPKNNFFPLSRNCVLSVSFFQKRNVVLRSRGKKEKGKLDQDGTSQILFDTERKSGEIWTKKYQPRYLSLKNFSVKSLVC
jgi:hypothetical protein